MAAYRRATGQSDCSSTQYTHMHTLSSLHFPHTPVIIAVSGGVDSMVLLHCALNTLPRESITVAHFDHKIRSEASGGDKRFVEEFCYAHHVKCITKSEDIVRLAQQHKQGIEAMGRKRRYEFLSEIAQNYDSVTILTAHHLDDRIETALFHLIRGTKFRGIHALRFHDTQILHPHHAPVSIARPMLGVSKSEILSYAETHQVPYREDSTNNDVTYTRNFIRNNILPQFEVINPQYRKAFDAFIHYTEKVDKWQSREIHHWLTSQNTDLHHLHQKFPDTPWIFSQTRFLEESEFFREQIIAYIYEDIHKNTIGLSYGLIRELLRFVE